MTLVAVAGNRLAPTRLPPLVIVGGVKAHARWLVATSRRAAGVHHLKHAIDDAMKMKMNVNVRVQA